MPADSRDWLLANQPGEREFAPLGILNRWWQTLTPRLPFQATTIEAWRTWRDEVRAAVTTHLGWTPPALSPQPVIRAEGEWEPGVRYRYGSVDTAPGMRVPFLLLLPEADGPVPGVLCIHGHGDGMNPLVGRDASGLPIENEYQHEFALRACRRGFAALTFDMLCFGRRRDFEHCAHYGINPCDTPTKLALQLGASMCGLRVFDARQMLTLLATQPEVDAERLGMAGISGGGTITFFTSVLDDRVRAAMISGYFNRFADFMQIHHCIDNFVPGLATVAEMPDLAGAIAPRPLLVSQGTRDPIFPLDATKAGVAALRRAYRLFDAEDALEEEYYEDDHVFSNARVWDFFAAHLGTAGTRRATPSAV